MRVNNQRPFNQASISINGLKGKGQMNNHQEFMKLMERFISWVMQEAILIINKSAERVLVQNITYFTAIWKICKNVFGFIFNLSKSRHPLPSKSYSWWWYNVLTRFPWDTSAEINIFVSTDSHVTEKYEKIIVFLLIRLCWQNFSNQTYSNLPRERDHISLL